MGLWDYAKSIGQSWQKLPPYSFLPPLFKEENEWPLPERPALGLEAERMQREHGKNLASFMNQMLTQNMAQLDRNWASIGRGSSGMLAEQKQRAIASGQWAGANVAGQGSLGILGQLLSAQTAREGMDEERMWRQAQLNQQGQTDNSQLGQLLMMLMLGG